MIERRLERAVGALDIAVLVRIAAARAGTAPDSARSTPPKPASPPGSHPGSAAPRSRARRHQEDRVRPPGMDHLQRRWRAARAHALACAVFALVSHADLCHLQGSEGI